MDTPALHPVVLCCAILAPVVRVVALAWIRSAARARQAVAATSRRHHPARRIDRLDG